jgi:hypothetical protein
MPNVEQEDLSLSGARVERYECLQEDKRDWTVSLEGLHLLLGVDHVVDVDICLLEFSPRFTIQPSSHQTTVSCSRSKYLVKTGKQESKHISHSRGRTGELYIDF